MVLASQKTRRGGQLFHRAFLKVESPASGLHPDQYRPARLSHIFAAMFGAGMAIQQIVSTLADNALGNRYMEDRLRFAYREIKAGTTTAAAFETAGGFPSLLLGAVRNGEKWPFRPLQLVIRLLNAEEETLQINIQSVADCAENPKRVTVTIIRDGFLDDSVHGDWHHFLHAGHASKDFSSSGDSMIVIRNRCLERLNAMALSLIDAYDCQNRIQA